MKKLVVYLSLLFLFATVAQAQHQCDSSDNYWSVVMPEPASQDVDMKQCLVGLVKDSLVLDFVKNVGAWKFRIDSIYIRGTDAKAFSIVSGYSKHTLLISESRNVEFRFVPNHIGLHEAEIVIITQAQMLIQRIQGEGVAPSLLVLKDFIDFGQVFIDQYKDTLQAVTIKNIGKTTLRINETKHNLPNEVDFSTLAGGGSFDLQPGDTARLDMRFKPSALGRTSGTLEFHYDGPGSPVVVQLFGEGIDKLPPELKIVNRIVDMGKAYVGDKKDSLQVITITNIGNVTINITDTRFSIPEFSNLSGTTVFSLNPGDTTKLDIRFAPNSKGIISGRIEFEYAESATPAIVQLFGEGEGKKAIIQADISAFDDLICDSFSNSELKISNTGLDTLKISEINFKGINPADYSYFGTLPIIIDPNSSKNILISFTPTSAGIKTADLEIKSNADPDSTLIVSLSAKKDLVSLVPDFNELDLGFLCPDESKTGSIMINNIGSLNSGGRIELSSSLSSSVDAFVIEKGDNFELSITFSGIANVGAFEEKITIIDSICGSSSELIIKGEVESPVIKSNDLTINSMVGTNKEGILTISNNSGRDAVIANVAGLIAPFELIAGQLPLTVEKGKSAELKINYLPTENKTDEIEITLSGEPCSFTSVATIKGISARGGAELKTIDISAFAGDEIEVPIILSSKENLDGIGITSIETDLEFNPTLLYPIGYNVEKINDKLAKIKLTGLSPDVPVGESMTKIKFIAALGNSDACDLALSNAKPIGAFADIKLKSGKFTLLGICREGGTRLINSELYGQLLNVSPNPSTGKLIIEMNLFEKGETRLTIYSPSGETIFSKEINNQTGRLEVNIQTQELASGTYYVNIQTPTLRKTVPVAVVK